MRDSFASLLTSLLRRKIGPVRPDRGLRFVDAGVDCSSDSGLEDILG